MFKVEFRPVLINHANLLNTTQVKQIT